MSDLDAERRLWVSEAAWLDCLAGAARRRMAGCVREMLLRGERPSGTYSLGEVVLLLRLTRAEEAELRSVDAALLDAVEAQLRSAEPSLTLIDGGAT